MPASDIFQLNLASRRKACVSSRRFWKSVSHISWCTVHIRPLLSSSNILERCLGSR